ncbi:MAG: hypothetical protein Ct9H300mP32_3800 [Verrucomicrobiota bacterium]|nr:MAG: hypothetical protein Ct9H300mP32_3800 [Verrucomicrobiota bacterium]
MPAAGQTWVYLGFVEEGKMTVKSSMSEPGGGERFRSWAPWLRAML